jgi:hypothetical protein
MGEEADLAASERAGVVTARVGRVRMETVLIIPRERN